MKTIPVCHPQRTPEAKAARFRARFLDLLTATDVLPPQLRMMLGPFVPMMNLALESSPDETILGIFEEIQRHIYYVNTGDPLS